eukprot:gnl/MRDRNA2_/MRDRNA2_53743_c0_seq2.p1 gnl/MRDRNA2_/MRDRNA2_53743_c0~~gnl/MRDRNA2_/MRDRNA2_53743_c0_seq2.p1  ORF type:complete len:270 (+),score=40.65 gnl/MRDRNA2_/MRDRNA2_53743_c0_seq2:99-908(+)
MMFGNCIAAFMFCFNNMLVQIHAANSKFLASTAKPSVNMNSSALPVSENASTIGSATGLAQIEFNRSDRSEENTVCEQSCREDNFPGPLEIARASMCELDYCGGCPACATVTHGTSTVTNMPVNESITTDATSRMPNEVNMAGSSQQEDQACKASCREEDFPGPREMARASMCELDYCAGCPQCVIVTSVTSIATKTQASESSTTRAASIVQTADNATGDSLQEDVSTKTPLSPSTTPEAAVGTPSRASVPFNTFASVIIGSMAVVALN